MARHKGSEGIDVERAVVFLDILGFRKLVSEQPAGELGQKFTRVVGQTLRAMNRPLLDPGTEPTLFPAHPADKTWCLSYAFSDSIIMVSHNNSQDACLAVLVYALRSMQYLLLSGFPVRGGAAFGEMYVDERASLFLGKALTTAYELEERQNWVGASLDDSLVAVVAPLFEATPTTGYPLMNALFPSYEVPMKNGPVRAYRTINWRWNLVVEKGTRSLFKVNDEWPARVKVENALNYSHYIRSSGLAYHIPEAEVPIEVRSIFVADGPPRATMTHGDDL